MEENASSAMVIIMTTPLARTAQSGRVKKIRPAVHKITDKASARKRSEERRVGKEC